MSSEVTLVKRTGFGRYPLVSFITCLLTFSAFILLLLVGLSLPIIKPIYLFTFHAKPSFGQPLSIATELRFGVWGVCATRYEGVFFVKDSRILTETTL